MFTCGQRTTRLSAMVCCALLLPALIGCGSKAEPDNEAQPTVDPRFASADALIEYYNSLSTRDPQDIEALTGLMYAENAEQNTSITLVRRAIVPISLLDFEMYQKFGEGLVARSNNYMLSPDKPAVITSREDRRAMARTENSDGKEIKLYLVQMNDRWWISGYTLQHRLGWVDTSDQSEMLNDTVDVMGEVTQDIRSQLRAGTLTSAAATRLALRKAVLTVAIQKGVERARQEAQSEVP
jgi:hypothetical protein